MDEDTRKYLETLKEGLVSAFEAGQDDAKTFNLITALEYVLEGRL